MYFYTTVVVHLVLGWIHQHSFTFINTMFTTIPTHIKSILIVNSKHAITYNSCRGHMINIQLLDLLGLWFAYYCDKMIGHAKEWVQLEVECIMVTS